MNRHRPHHPLTLLAITTGLALAVTGCASDGARPSASDTAAGTTTPSARPHGFVEGATEAAEPQLRLLAVSSTGATTLHDLLSGETTSLEDVDAPDHSATDGRFLVTSDDDRTTITDGGAWTVDHGDHTHYYAAGPRVVGTLDGGGPVAVHSSETVTTVTWPDRGEAIALDREALGQGELDELVRLEASVLLPVDGGYVAAQDDTVRVLDEGGAANADAAACTGPSGGITTRAGAVVGCADGAIVVDEDGATRTVDLPGGAAPRPTSFAARAGRPTVAGVAGDTGAWLLDARAGAWEHVPTERPLRTVVAVDDEDEHVVALDDSGRVVVVTGTTGEVASTDPLVPPGSEPLLQLDAGRAYLADPATGTVHEIDFADDARVARTIDVGAPLAAFAEVGR